MTVYFFVGHTLPTEHPNAVRIANLGLIFKALGYKVTLVGFDSNGDRETEYKGMRCVIFNQRTGGGLTNYLKREREALNNIKTFFKENECPQVIVSGLFNCKLQRFLISFAKAQNVKMIETVCEWYDRTAFQGVVGVFKYINNRYSMYRQFVRVGNIISISTCIEKYYKSKGCNVVVIPTIADFDEYDNLAIYNKNEKRIITYAGSPAKKDFLLNILKAIDLLNESERNTIELHIYGLEEKQLLELGLSRAFIERHRDTVFSHGRIPYKEVKNRLAESDFTILLRPNKRYANAGFPTKVGESMACGTPVITNLTSDLGNYLLDGENSIISRDETVDECAFAIRRAISLGDSALYKMRLEALNTAKQRFDYKSYINHMHVFLR